MTIDDKMDYSKEVRDALVDGKPLVALESTIMTHGMPFPENLETALSVESIIREESVVPATCLLYTSPSPRDATLSRMPSSA